MATRIIPRQDVVQDLNQSAHILLHEDSHCLSFFSFFFKTILTFFMHLTNPDPFKVMLLGQSEPCAVFGTILT